MNNNISILGFNNWQQHTGYENFDREYTVLRVIEVNRNSFMIADGSHELQAELSGRFVYNSANSAEFPAVGDWVEAEVFGDYVFAIIHNVLPRNTLLKRKSAGRRIDFQLIAANVDTGLIIQATDNMNVNLFERYLVMLNNSGIEPIAVITKIDLLDNTEVEILQSKISRLNCQSILLDNTDLECFKTRMGGLLVSEKTYCLLGPSGAGKSTITNNFLQQQIQKTAGVRIGDGKGRHTTVRRQLLRLDSGAILIDTPGMRELGNFAVGSGIESTFPELDEYAQSCRFADCTHTHEQGCAVKAAVESGVVAAERYENYLKLKKESEYYGMKYYDKIQKDKNLSRVIRNYRKNHRKF